MARLLFFGKLGDLAGGREREFALPEGVVAIGGLIKALAVENETLGVALQEESVRFAVNEKFVGRNGSVCGADEIAFLPPVSGG